MRILIFLSVILLSNSSLLAQNGQIILTAFGNGDIEQIAPYLANNVEICIGDEVDYYPKKKARIILADFFLSVRPIEVSPLHKGASKDKSSKYIIGKLVTENGSYRLFVYVKKKDSMQRIKEVRLEIF